MYTVPAGTTSVTIGLTVANIVATQIKVTVLMSGVHIIKDAPIPANSALSVLDGKIILEAGDDIVIISNEAASTDVILSVLEQT
jgi:hypothetical protein